MKTIQPNSVFIAKLNYHMEAELIEKKKFDHATIWLAKKNNQVAVVEATKTYIPFEAFKEIFTYVGELAASQTVAKLVFDKRKLSVFHQPSMEWYFVEWKEKMYDLGMRTHRKILPNDEVFKQSVKIGREKIKKSHPQGKFMLMDIAYADDLAQAINS